MKTPKDKIDLSTSAGRIRYTREVLLDMTQEEFGALCGGKTKGAVSQWESGSSEMGGAALIAFWKSSHVNPEWLLYGRGPEKLPLASLASHEDEARSVITRILLSESGYDVDRLLQIEKKVKQELGENIDKNLLVDVVKRLYKLESEQVNASIIRAFFTASHLHP